MHARQLQFFAGPTAAGKTAAALAWAEANGGEVLSCDSLLFYRGMDLGTAKPTPAERARVRHHGLDLAEPREAFTVAAYGAYARAVVEDAAARGVPLCVAGGSGFYLEGFFRPMADELPGLETANAEVRALEASGGLPALLAELARFQPGGRFPGDFDTRNPRRVAAALARARVTGLSVEGQRARLAAVPDPWASWERRRIYLDRPDAELRARIAARTTAMLRDGLVDEVRRLRAGGFEANPSAARAVGYRQVLEHLDGALPEAALEAAVNTATWQLVRKQRAWFRSRGWTAAD